MARGWLVDDVGVPAINDFTANRKKPHTHDRSSGDNGGEEDRLIADCEALINAAKRFFSLRSPYHIAEAAGASAASLEAAKVEQLRLFELVETCLVKTAATKAATGRGADAKRCAIEVFEEYKCDGASSLTEGLRQSYLNDMERLLRASEPAPAPARGWFRRLAPFAYGETSPNADA